MEEGRTMRKQSKKTVWLTMMLLIAGCVAAWADGGTETAIEQCKNPPMATDMSPRIEGTFTATYIQKEGALPKKFDIHVVLSRTQLLEGKEKKTVHLLRFTRADTEGWPLCKYTTVELGKKYWPTACNRYIQKLFNIDGYPVLTDLKILSQDHCEDRENAMIYGSFMLRVVKPGN